MKGIGKKMTEIRPDYYKSGGLEAFDVIDAFNLDFNLGNAFKYIARAGKKNSKVKDLRKAVTYLNREIEKEDKKRIDEEFRRKIEKMETAPIMMKKEASSEDIARVVKEELEKRKSDYEAGRQENL